MAKRSSRRSARRSNPVARIALVVLMAIVGAAACAILGAMFALVGMQGADMPLVGETARIFLAIGAAACALPGLIMGAGFGLSVRP